jgi:high-affinity iron transporter
MFAAALIVFRESLEAALFVGIVAAATRHLVGRSRWLAAGVGIGAFGAVALALMAQHISSGFDGLGQDLVNIGVLSLALTMLTWHCVWVTTHSKEMVLDARQLGTAVQQGHRRPWALLVAVALAVLREGAETVLFVGGAVTGSAAEPGSVLLSCALGLVAGGVVGAFIYSGLARIPARQLFATTNVLIALLAASIASQLARALTQAGLIETWSTPLWDSSRLLGPDSALGTLLHALVGYDARPSGLQLASYLAALLFIVVATRLLRRTPGPA